MTREIHLGDLWSDALKETGARTYDEALECFAKKVAAAEREACAVACENEYVTVADADDEAYNRAIKHGAAAIRARGA